ncbi:MAG: class I SAM-dependent methyltransferase [Anaerolineales bacterium]|nr:class I SAM-dependent methyltransferase [Anaerolineales bacterium]
MSELHTPSTSQSKPDYLKIGSTSGQRGAEIIAALRAKMNPSPVARALTSRNGRLIAQLLQWLPGDKTAFNYVPARHQCITALTRQAISTKGASPTIVEVAAGFSGRGLQLAVELPHAKIIEVDLPTVIETKLARLRQAVNLPIPTNIRWLKTNLEHTSLAQLLSGEKANIVIAEGLLIYFEPAMITRIAKGIYDSLSENGVLIADIYYRQGLTEAATASGAATKMMQRQAGKFLGIAKDETMAKAFFTQADFHHVDVYQLKQLSGNLQIPYAVPNAGFLIVAYKRRPSVSA